MLASSLAFVPQHVQNHMGNHQQQQRQHQQQLQSRVTATEKARPSVALSMGAKTGGKLISTSNEYTELVTSTAAPRPVLVFFTAPWCGPCRLSIPVVKDVMKLFAGQIDVVEVCTDDLPEVCADSGVVSIPTIQMYYKSELMDTIVGCVAKGVLSSAVEKVLDQGAPAKLDGKAP
jgi:thioredoxin 1